MFIEVVILCSCYLRVLHACRVQQFPDQYINKRWCKDIKDGQNVDSRKSIGNEPMVRSSVWKMQMMRKMNSLVTASQMNMNTRAHYESILWNSRNKLNLMWVPYIVKKMARGRI